MKSLTSLLLLILPHLLSAARTYGGPFDWMCAADEGMYARADPWDCTVYYMCSAGQAYPFHCPPGTIFNKIDLVCDWAHKMDPRMCSGRNPLGLFDPICQWQPHAKLASQLSCAQYYDCSQSASNQHYAKYVMECPYPQLFSESHGTCLHYSMVQCGTRPVPKAPCDYIQYQQNCPDPRRCPPCSHRHPSCVGRANGVQSIPTITHYYMYCDAERTINIEQCPNRHVFSQPLRRCVPVLG